MKPIFPLFEQILNSAEKVTFSIEKTDDGMLRVSVIPALTAAPDNLPDDQADLRAALAYPLVIKESADTLDADFPECLTTFANSRTSIQSSLTILQSLKDSANRGRNAASKAKDKSARKTAGSTTKSASKGEAGNNEKDIGGTVPPPSTDTTTLDATDATLL